jgi:type IV pilus assembly protein PilM
MNSSSIVDKLKNTSKKWIEKVHRLLNTNFDRAFGLDISDKSIELAELSKLFRFSIENYGRIELPDGIIKEGRILDEKALAAQIRILLQNVKPRRVSTNKVILSLPESQVFSHHLVMNTTLTGVQLRLSVQKEIVKVLPVNLNRMYWDISVKPVQSDGLSITFVGVMKDVAEAYVRVCNSIGLSVISLSLEALSVARLILAPDNVITALVDLGTNTTNVSLVKGNDEIELTISIPIGGRAMTQAIAQGLNIDEVEAEKKKISVGATESDELFFLIEPVIKNISMEITRIIAYYEEASKEKVSSVLLVGGASVMGGIKKEMAEIIGRPVSPVTHFNNFETISALGGKNNEDKNIPMLYTSVIGLGMLGASNEFNDINLLKQMSGASINNINRTELFNSGYLSKITAARIFLNSRLMLVISMALCVGSVLTFGYLYFTYQTSKTYQEKVYRTANLKIDALSSAFKPELYLGTTTPATASSTATSTPKTATTTKK